MSLHTLKARLEHASPDGWGELAGHRGHAALSPADWELVAHARQDLELAVQAFAAFYEHLGAIVELGTAQNGEGNPMERVKRLRAAQRRLDLADRQLTAVLGAMEGAP